MFRHGDAAVVGLTAVHPPAGQAGDDADARQPPLDRLDDVPHGAGEAVREYDGCEAAKCDVGLSGVAAAHAARGACLVVVE